MREALNRRCPRCDALLIVNMGTDGDGHVIELATPCPCIARSRYTREQLLNGRAIHLARERARAEAAEAHRLARLLRRRGELPPLICRVCHTETPRPTTRGRPPQFHPACKTAGAFRGGGRGEGLAFSTEGNQ